MYILEKITLDKAHRLNVSSLFRENSAAPKEVALVFDTETKCLLIEDADNLCLRDDPDWMGAPVRKVDSKKRVCIPSWMYKEFGTEFYVANRGGSYRIGQALLPKKYYPDVL